MSRHTENRGLLSPRSLVLSVGLLISATGLRWLAAGSPSAALLEHLSAVAAATGLALLGTALLQGLAVRHMTNGVSALVRQTIAVAVWSIALGILAGIVFEVPVGSLVTTSGVMVAVIGIALKNMISDLFSGLLMPVQLGDWIEVDGQIGRVVEVSWRATGLLTESSISIIVPNTHLMARPFRNFSHPDPWYRESLRITLPLEVSAEQAERNLLAAAWSLDLEGEPPFPPSTRIRGFTERGVDWELRFFVPNAAQASTLRSQVHRALLHNLRMAGLGLPSDSLILHAPLATGTERTGRQALGSFLRGVELFDGLTDAELERVAADADHHPVPAGQTVMRQGEEGASLFILREGLLRVSICDAEGLETDVGEILPGHFFGEMSLLTGDHRSATVRAQTDSRICEITRESLQPLLQERPDLVRQLSETLADRQMRNAPKLNRIGPPDLLSGDVSRHSLVKSLFLRISAAFRLVEAP